MTMHVRLLSIDVFEKALAGYRTQFGHGDQLAVLRALHECFRYEQPVPSWAAVAFSAIWERFNTEDAASLDTLFDVKTGKRAHTARRRFQAELLLWAETWTALALSPVDTVEGALKAAMKKTGWKFRATKARAAVLRIDKTQSLFRGPGKLTLTQYAHNKRRMAMKTPK